MKKFLSLILALAMVACMSVTAFAADNHSGTQTVTTSKAAPNYTLTIPADTSIPWGKTDPHLLGDFTVTVDSDWDVAGKGVWVTWGVGGTFTSTTPGVTTTIPYNLSYSSDMTPCSGFTIDFSKETSRTYTAHVNMQVTQDAWDAADPGEYSTTITYTSKVVNNN